MFQTGDNIVYGKVGVCRVESIGPLKGMGSDPKRDYYTLADIRSGSTIYTPVDTSTFMRPILSRDEVDELIDRLPDIEAGTCEESSMRMISEHYQAAFDTHRCEDLIAIMKEAHQKAIDSRQRGKRAGLTDQRYQKQAEELIYGEFAVALDIPYDDVAKYIKVRLDGK